MANQFEDLIPKTMPPTIADPGPIAAHTGAFWETPLGWLGFTAFSVVLILVVIFVLVFLFRLAMNMLYLTTFSATRGVRDGWYPPAPQQTPMPFRPALRSEEEQRVEIRKMLVMETLRLQPESWKGAPDRQLLDSFPPTARIGGQRRTS